MPRTIAIGFFIFWLLILLAGADKPPPPGFIWIVLTVAVCAAVVYWRSQTYVMWYRTQRPGRYWRVIVDGLVAGFLVSVPFMLRGSGEPSVVMSPSDYVIWAAVLSMMGLFNAVVIYGVVALATPRAVS